MTGTKDERIAHVERRLKAINKHAQMLHDKLMRAERRAEALERYMQKVLKVARRPAPDRFVSHVVAGLAKEALNKHADQPAQDAGRFERTSHRPWLPHGVCHADGDGHCAWEYCPQLRDNEPAKSGRHCPLDTFDRAAADQSAQDGDRPYLPTEREMQRDDEAYNKGWNDALERAAQKAERHWFAGDGYGLYTADRASRALAAAIRNFKPDQPADAGEPSDIPLCVSSGDDGVVFRLGNGFRFEVHDNDLDGLLNDINSMRDGGYLDTGITVRVRKPDAGEPSCCTRTREDNSDGR
jgi:hypothetical protein